MTRCSSHQLKIWQYAVIFGTKMLAADHLSHVRGYVRGHVRVVRPTFDAQSKEFGPNHAIR